MPSTQADSKLSERLGGDTFKEFISQHEMTLVNFYAPHRSSAKAHWLPAARAATPLLRRPSRLARAAHGARGKCPRRSGADWRLRRRSNARPQSPIPLPLVPPQVVRLVPPSGACLPRGRPHVESGKREVESGGWEVGGGRWEVGGGKRRLGDATAC